jgi:hypothetical protein
MSGGGDGTPSEITSRPKCQPNPSPGLPTEPPPASITNLSATRYGADQADTGVRVRLGSHGDRPVCRSGTAGGLPEISRISALPWPRGRCQNGIGIGLFISRQIAERMGGALVQLAGSYRVRLTFLLDQLRAAVEHTGAAALPETEPIFHVDAVVAAPASKGRCAATSSAAWRPSPARLPFTRDR